MNVKMLNQSAMSLFLVVCLSVAAAAQTSAYYGIVTGDKVNVRGGAGDWHVVLGVMRKNYPIKILKTEGDWCKVEIPGGAPVWIAMEQGKRAYIRETEPGEAVVLVDDLMIRGVANKDWPPVGRVGLGDRLVLLDKRDGWARVLSPPGVNTWIHKAYVARSEEQKAAQASFEVQHKKSREALLNDGRLSREVTARESKRAEMASRAKAAFDAFNVEKAKQRDQRNIAGLRSSLSQVRDETPVGSVERVKAESLLSLMGEWEQNRATMSELHRQLKEAAAAEKEAKLRYQGTLEELRVTKVTKITRGSGPKAGLKDPYIARGYVGRTFPVTGIVDFPGWELRLGVKRVYFIDSDRYKLSDYEGKLIGIREAGPPETRPGLDAKLLRITRLEILHPGRHKGRLGS